VADRNAKSQDQGEPDKNSAGSYDISQATAQTRQIINALDPTLRDLRKEVGDTKDAIHKELRNILYVFGAGFLVIGGMIIAGYFRLDDRIVAMSGKYDDRIQAISNTGIRVDTKLEDLLQRIPPVQTAAKHP
jgi:hypothetical protein